MRIGILPGRALPAGLAAQWSAIQRADRRLESPFFCPEFTQAVAAIRNDVEVAVIEDRGSVVGLFPFQRARGKIGRPVGGPLSDLHGLIMHPEWRVNASELLRGSHLSAWHFDHLPVAQTTFSDCQWMRRASPYIDTSGGFEAYRAERQRVGSHVLSRSMQKLRKLEREVGPVRIEIDVHDESVLQTALAWKADQYRRSRLFNAFALPWTQTLLRHMLNRDDDDCRGMLFALKVNDELQSVLYCLRSRRVLHAWLAAYRQDLAKYSPGSLLWVAVIRAAQELGIDRIDMGKGDQPYKTSFMSGMTLVAQGSLDSRSAVRFVRQLRERVHSRLRESPLRGPLTIPWRWLKLAVGQAQCK